MPASQPDLAELMRVVAVYLRLAYPDGTPPAVAKILAVIQDTPGDPLKCPAFCPEPKNQPVRYLLRLGNFCYPHMKLVVEKAPDGSRFLYRADTHDRHICPPNTSPEHAAFCALMEKNQRLAEAMDAAWERAAVPTFKSYLREDLRRRIAVKAATS